MTTTNTTIAVPVAGTERRRAAKANVVERFLDSVAYVISVNRRRLIFLMASSALRARPSGRPG